MHCLEDADLTGLIEGTLGPGELARIDAHVDVCATCRAVVADLVAARSIDAHDARAREDPPAAPEVGRRYVLLDLIGQGGMGRVYRALDRLTGQTVALKRVLIRPREGGSTPAADLDAPAREFRALATLRHPNIVSVLDYGFDADRRPYFTMELLGGAAPLLSVARPLPHAARIQLLVQLLRALGYLHRRGILHRDLKPSNLLVVAGEEGPALKVVDFGLSSWSDEARPDRPVGTLPYMAPELLRGGAASEASDLYAVGVLACEVLAGHRPFRAGTPAELIADTLGAEPDLTLLPPAIGAVLRRALCKTPSGRPADAATLLSELTEAAGAAPAADPAPCRDSFLVAARFTGREEELGRLRGALEEARRGRGSAWLVGGESGVGKSRLLEELRCRALVEGVIAGRGQGLPDGGTAYHVWRGVLEMLALHVELSDLEAGVIAAVVPSLGAILERAIAPPPELDVQATRSRLREVLRDVVRRSAEPLLVLLEDLQWADAESLALLAQVSLDLAEAPVLVVGSFRDDEARRLPAAVPAARALPLARFDRRGVADLCEAMLGPTGRDERLVDLVARETEGNAFFVVEVVRALAEESGGLGIGPRGLPERVLAGGVEQVFERRLARVPREARPLLHLAAVAGRQLDLDVLGRGCPGAPALVLACAEAGVVEMHEQRWRFGHDRLRERVMRGLDPAARAALHARLAEDLEAIHGEGPAHAARIAHHYREAGRPGPAARFYALAGDAALARGAPGEASAMLEQAVLLHDRVDVPALWRVRVWRGLTQARYGLGQLGGTDDALRRACSAAGVPLPSGRLGWWRALGRGVGEQIARRAGLAQRLGLDPVDETDRAIREELLVALWAHEIYVWLTRPDIHVVCTLRGLNLEEALGASSRTNFRSAIAFLLSYTPLHRLCRHYLDRAEATSPPGSHAETELLRIHSIVEVNQGRTAEGDASAARAVACARARRDDVSLMYSLVQLQLAAGGRDDYPRVLAISSEIEALAARAESPRFATIALLGQGLAWTQLGDLAQAEAVLDRAMAAPGHELGPLQEALGAGFSALCALRRGRLARADALALRALSAVDRARWPMLELRHALFCGLEVLLAEDRDDLPAAPIRRALAVFHRLERRFPAAEPSAQLFQGRYEWRAGRPARAAACLRRSVRAAERTDARYEGAVARYWLGLLAASAPGRRHVPEGAARHLGAALAAFERLGAVREAARARAALGGVARAT